MPANSEASKQEEFQRARSFVSRARAFCTAVPVLTVLFLLLIDILLRSGNAVDSLGFRSVDLWDLPPRIKYCKQTQPDVALLGSSLMLVLNQDGQGRHFYSGFSAPYLQAALSAAVNQEIRCVNLCSGLQMISEGFLIAEAITSERRYPRVIIYGLALRDFIHDYYASEWKCDSFFSIAPFVPVTPLVLSVLSSDKARLEFILSHYWFLYRDRTDFANVMSAITKDLLESLPLDQPFPRLGPDHQFRPQSKGILWERWVPRQQEQFAEQIFKTHPEFLKEYYRKMQTTIYQQGQESTRLLEAKYLDQLVALCRSKGITLVLIDMPVSPEISQLIPEGLNEAFRGYLTELSQQRGVVLIDLFGDHRFASDCFKDGVHLNYFGAKQLVDVVLQNLSEKYRWVFEDMKRDSPE